MVSESFRWGYLQGVTPAQLRRLCVLSPRCGWLCISLFEPDFGRGVGHSYAVGSCDVGGAGRVVEESPGVVPGGAVPLAAAIGALRTELMHAVWAGQFPYELNGQQR